VKREHFMSILETYYEAFNAKNWRGMIELLDEKVVHAINQGPTVVGRDSFFRFVQSMGNHYDEHLSEMVLMINGTRGAAEFVCQGTYLRTDNGFPEARGQKYKLPVGAFFEFSEDGKILRVSNYYNQQDWMLQVSVS
jgi:steroid delta-isomerase-like uncharacterized protein